MSMKGTSTYVPQDEIKRAKSERPFPPKARRLGIIFSASLMALALLPVVIEASGVMVQIGPWLSMLITIPITLFAMVMMGFLREGMWTNMVSGAAVLFAMTMGYALEFDIANYDVNRVILLRSVCPAVCAVVIVFFWLSIRTSLRDLHYLIAEGQSMQDIMLRAQQANIIRKKGGKPALMPDGTVVDANEVVGRPGFRTPAKEAQAGAATAKKKRKKPKVR